MNSKEFQLVIVILTYNEAIHIERSITNVLGWADKVIVLDSYSQDETTAIAKNLGVEVICRKFDNYKNQRQHAIDYCKEMTEWMLFLDADEYLLEPLKAEIKIAIANEGISGYYLKRRAIFMNRWIRHGGYYPTYLLRLFRPEVASIDREINEHVMVSGVVKSLQNDFVDHNLKGVNFWIEKHNRYATQEALSLWHHKQQELGNDKRLSFWRPAEQKRWLRERVWNHLPILVKPFLYFIFRYFFRLGFLDGKEGLAFHFLQGCWFWFLVDVKYLEMQKQADKQLKKES